MLLSIQNLKKSFGENIILNGINFSVYENSRLGLIGQNGAGKTTLLNLIVGKDLPDEGEIIRSSELTIGYLKQNEKLSSEKSIYEEMKSVFAPLLEIERFLRETELKLSKIKDSSTIEFKSLSEAYNKKSEYFNNAGGYLIDVTIKTILNGLGFTDYSLEQKVSSLSGGEKTRLAIARLLLEEPNLLILDEPTNHLDFKTLTWLENYLTSYKKAYLIVSHDRYFLDKTVSEILEVSNHHLYSFPGNYSKYLVLKEERIRLQEKTYLAQQEEISKLTDYVNKNLVRASTSNMAKSRQKALEKMDIIEKPFIPQKKASFRFEYDKEPFKDIVDAKNLSLSVGEEKKRLFSDLSLHISRGEKIAVIGQNGVGKSSLLKALLGIIPFDSGKILWSKNLVTSYYEQENANLNLKNSVIDEIWNRYRKTSETAIRTLLGRVGLSGDDIYKRVGNLSGGERARLCFAIIMQSRANFLILDEPTNHLDLFTKEELEKALVEYKGTLFFVSHDRYLLNKVPDKIMELFPDRFEIYEGNYDYYISQKELREEKKSLQKEEIVKALTTFYRSKEEKRAEAEKKAMIKGFEKRIEKIEEQISVLENELVTKEVLEDYRLMNEKCTIIENLKKELAEVFDKWCELSEE